MSAYVHGRTLCSLCGAGLHRDQALLGFPAFLPSDHGLAFMSDATVHRECFEAWEHRRVFSVLLDRFNRLLDQRPRELDWRAGEQWIRARTEEFDREAAALDPTKART